jgi:hypothetical protein
MQPSQRVILELETGASPIQGWVAANGRRSRFDGYVQLIGQLEALQRVVGFESAAGGLEWAGLDPD